MNNKNNKQSTAPTTTALQIVNQQEVFGKQFRMYGDFENPLFLAKDVAEWIEYAKTGTGKSDVSRMLNTVDEDEKLVRKIFVSGQHREVWLLTEEGLYEVLMQSTKPIAKQFKRKVKEILKQLRQTGYYMMGEFQIPKDYRNALLLAAKQQGQIEYQQAIIEEQTPKVEFYDKAMCRSDLLTATQIAADYGMKASDFNLILQRMGIQWKHPRRNNNWCLKVPYLDQGYTHTYTATASIHSAFGVKTTMCWTQKGREFLYKKLKAEGYLPLAEIVR